MASWTWTVDYGYFFRSISICDQKWLQETLWLSWESNKSEFWYFSLLFLLAYAVVWLIDHRFLTTVISLNYLPFGNFIPAGYLDHKVGLTLLLYRPIMAAPTFSVTVSRLNELKNRSWWCCPWVLSLLIVAWFWLIHWLIRPSAQTINIWARNVRPECERSPRAFQPVF